jgi:putative protease
MEQNVEQTPPTRGEGRRKPELMAPAGEPDCAYAAFQHGADAVYLGLKEFSARAEAVNFSLDDLSEIVAYAHAARPRRRVYVAMNTLVTDNELSSAMEQLAEIAAVGVDAAIVQDLGLVHAARRHFPELPLHASTQMAIHNEAGALEARAMGFKRVTLARELTLEEVAAIVRRCCGPEFEAETFVHGALCYSYSGLCLYSSLLRGRSGNRGACAYPCRDAFRLTGDASDGADGPCFPYSMRDLALPDEVAPLAACGVASLKIEGRMKNPLYVACATAFYRGLLDGSLKPDERREMEDDMKTIFSRPWTSLYLRSRQARDVTDSRTVGHRGAGIGIVAAAVPAGGRSALRFVSRRRIERHDGLQIDLPGHGRPFGFAVDVLRLVWSRTGGGRKDDVFEVPAGSLVEVPLPRDHPAIPAGAPVYCSSSQRVKQHYRSERPKPGSYRVTYGVDVTVSAGPAELTATGRLTRAPAWLLGVEAKAQIGGPFLPSRKAEDELAAAARRAFARLGDTRFELGSLAAHNPRGLFVPISLLNDLRRALATRLDEAFSARVRERAAAGRASVLPPAPAAEAAGGVAWALKTDRLANLDLLEARDWEAMVEVVVEVDVDDADALLMGLEALGNRAGRERIRLALPLITRSDEEGRLREKTRRLVEAGWRRWEAANLSGLEYLREAGGLGAAGGDLSADWGIPVANRAAARQVLALGASGFVVTPEDGWADVRPLLAEFGDRATVLVYGDVPLFVSETCPKASREEGCVGREACDRADYEMRSRSGETVCVATRRCRSYTLTDGPYMRTGRIATLTEWGARRFRVEFMYRTHAPEAVRETWRRIVGA